MTGVEVLQEILHRCSAIDRREVIGPAFRLVLDVVHDILPIEKAAVIRAGEIAQSRALLSARDSVHIGKSPVSKKLSTSLAPQSGRVSNSRRTTRPPFEPAKALLLDQLRCVAVILVRRGPSGRTRLELAARRVLFCEGTSNNPAGFRRGAAILNQFRRKPYVTCADHQHRPAAGATKHPVGERHKWQSSWTASWQ